MHGAIIRERLLLLQGFICNRLYMYIYMYIYILQYVYPSVYLNIYPPICISVYICICISSNIYSNLPLPHNINLNIWQNPPPIRTQNFRRWCVNSVYCPGRRRINRSEGREEFNVTVPLIYTIQILRILQSRVNPCNNNNLSLMIAPSMKHSVGDFSF